MRIDPNKPLFPISTVAEMLECPQKVLRLYEKNGLVEPARSDGKRRLYCQRDVELLEFIHYLTHARRVNVAGVKVILELREHIDDAKWISIIRRAEENMENLPDAEKRLLEEGNEIVMADLEDAAPGPKAVEEAG